MTPTKEEFERLAEEYGVLAQEFRDWINSGRPRFTEIARSCASKYETLALACRIAAGVVEEGKLEQMFKANWHALLGGDFATAAAAIREALIGEKTEKPQ